MRLKKTKMQKQKKYSLRKCIIMMAISLLLIFYINNILYEVYDCIDYLGNRIESRKISINMSGYIYDEVQNELIKYLDNSKEVQAYCDIDGYGVTVFGPNIREEYEIYSLDAYLPEVMETYMLTDIDDLKNDEMIIAKYITKDGYTSPEKTMDYIDGEDYIGREVKCTVRKVDGFTGEVIDNKEYNFTIVGVYDNIKGGDSGSAYISKNVAKEMAEYRVWYEDEYVDSEEYNKYEQSVDLYAVVEDCANIDYVISDIKKIIDSVSDENLKEFYLIQVPQRMNETAIIILEGIRLIGNFTAVYLILSAIINIILYIKESIEKRKREFGIMKAIGYRDFAISLILLREVVAEILISLSLVYGIGIVSFEIANAYIKNQFSVFWNMIKFETVGYVNAVILVIGILVPLVGYIFGTLRLRKLQPMEALR